MNEMEWTGLSKQQLRDKLNNYERDLSAMRCAATAMLAFSSQDWEWKEVTPKGGVWTVTVPWNNRQNLVITKSEGLTSEVFVTGAKFIEKES